MSSNDQGSEGERQPLLSSLQDNTAVHEEDRDELPPPPDGGKAWIQVLAGALVLFNTWGYITSYALFESYYTKTLNLNLADVSWAGSVQIFILFFIGTFSGRAVDAGYFQLTLTTGILLQLIGVFSTSFATEFWQLFLAQGICGGLGGGLVFCPMISLVSTYFARRKALALSLIASGTALGGVIFPVIAMELLPQVGFGWTVRVMGFVMLFNDAIILSLAKPRLPPCATGPIVQWDAFREPPFTLFTIGLVLVVWSLYVAFSYITAYATDVIGVSSYTSLIILLILNGIGAPGRIIPGLLADVYFGPINTIIPCIFLCGIAFYVWAAVHTVNELFVWAVIFGFVDSAVQGLLLAGVTTLTPDLQKAGVRSGMILSCLSTATLTGGPLFGALVDAGGGSYIYAQIWGGTTLLVGGAFIMAARVAKVGWEVKKRM